MHESTEEILVKSECEEGVSPSFFEQIRERAPGANAEQPRSAPSQQNLGTLLRRLVGPRTKI